MNIKIAQFKAVIIIIAAFTLFSCAKEDDGIYFNNTSEVISLDKVSYSELETEVLNLINKHRQSLGLASLNTINSISAAADGHTNYMVEKDEINHDNFAQRSQYLMTNENAKTVAEVVAYGYVSAQGVLNGWLNSEAHRKTIESEKFTHFGISIACNSNNRNYFTQIFISK